MPETIDHADIENAVGELVTLSGVPAPLIWDAVREQAPGGYGDAESLREGVTAVVTALQESGHLSGPGADPEQRFALAAPEDDAAWMSPDMSEADRALVAVHRRAAAAGPGYRKHFEGMLKINPEIASALGLAAGDDDGDDPASEAARIVNRQAHTGFFSSSGPRDGAAHTSACPPDCSTDHRQNRKAVSGASGNAEVDAVVGRHAGSGMFGREDPISGNQSTANWTREADRH